MGEDWNDSLQSKEQIEVNLLHKYEAAMRRERALAYSFSHQVLLLLHILRKIRGFTYLGRTHAQPFGKDVIYIFRDCIFMP